MLPYERISVTWPPSSLVSFLWRPRVSSSHWLLLTICRCMSLCYGKMRQIVTDSEKVRPSIPKRPLLLSLPFCLAAGNRESFSFICILRKRLETDSHMLSFSVSFTLSVSLLLFPQAVPSRPGIKHQFIYLFRVFTISVWILDSLMDTYWK
jgi:hypothetical protein